MTSSNGDLRDDRERETSPLDVAKAAFDVLVSGPHPVGIDGRRIPGFPRRWVALNQVRDLVLNRDCPQPVRDAVWGYLIRRSQAEGAAWTVGCVGVALPALTAVAAQLAARFVADPVDIDAEVLRGFLAALPTVDLTQPWIMARLRWEAFRAGLAAIREALDAPTPAVEGFHSQPPPPPWGHPDFVLARAVAEGVITTDEADLIGATRLEHRPCTAPEHHPPGRLAAAEGHVRRGRCCRP